MCITPISQCVSLPYHCVYHSHITVCITPISLCTSLQYHCVYHSNITVCITPISPPYMKEQYEVLKCLTQSVALYWHDTLPQVIELISNTYIIITIIQQQINVHPFRSAAKEKNNHTVQSYLWISEQCVLCQTAL